MSLVFIKIHKCSSTSVRELLENDYAEKNKLKIVKKNNGKRKFFFRKKNKKNHEWIVNNPPYELFTRHESYDRELFQDFMSNPIQYITFLREPLNRAFSTYHSNDVPPNSSIFKNISFEEWYMKNRSLINKKPSLNNDKSVWVLSSNWMSYMCGFDSLVEITEESIKNRFNFIGTTENFNESIDKLGVRLNHTFDTDKMNKKVRKNNNKPKLKLDNSFINIFKEDNKLDYKLYNLVQKIY